MKKLFFSIFSTATLISSASSACMDPGAKRIDTKAALVEYGNNASFNACAAEMKAVGVKLNSKDTYIYRKDRDANSNDPVIYQLLIMGMDGQKKMVKIKLSYDLRNHAFTCADGIDYRITRGGCF